MRLALVIAPLAVLGCGLDLDGLGRGVGPDAASAPMGDAGAVSDAVSSGDDAGQDSNVEAATGSCVASIPAGWNLVLFESSRDPCPAGLTSTDLVDEPLAPASACTCPCTVTTQPSCTSGTLQGGFGSGNGAAACATKVPPLSISSTGCTQLQPGGPAPASIMVEPLPATGGSCTASALGDSTQVTSTPVRTCSVTGPDAEAVCEGASPSSAGFTVCIAAPGDTACPSGSPFANLTVVAAAETLVCTACSACTVSGSCSSPLVTYYSDYLCLDPVATFPADGACTQPNWSGNLAGVEYHATVQSSCAGSGSAPAFQAVSPQTLCCR